MSKLNADNIQLFFVCRFYYAGWTAHYGFRRRVWNFDV